MVGALSNPGRRFRKTSTGNIAELSIDIKALTDSTTEIQTIYRKDSTANTVRAVKAWLQTTSNVHLHQAPLNIRAAHLLAEVHLRGTGRPSGSQRQYHNWACARATRPLRSRQPNLTAR